VLMGKGDGTFQAKTDYDVGTCPYSVAVGDFNGDGKTDLVATSLARYRALRSLPIVAHDDLFCGRG